MERGCDGSPLALFLFHHLLPLPLLLFALFLFPHLLPSLPLGRSWNGFETLHPRLSPPLVCPAPHGQRRRVERFVGIVRAMRSESRFGKLSLPPRDLEHNRGVREGERGRGGR